MSISEAAVRRGIFNHASFVCLLKSLTRCIETYISFMRAFESNLTGHSARWNSCVYCLETAQLDVHEWKIPIQITRKGENGWKNSALNIYEVEIVRDVFDDVRSESAMFC